MIQKEIKLKCGDKAQPIARSYIFIRGPPLWLLVCYLRTTLRGSEYIFLLFISWLQQHITVVVIK